jgi:hypothetical protein
VVELAAVLVCLLLGALAVFQVLLALGAPLGHLAWGGQHRVLPTRLRVGSLFSVVVYAVVAAAVAGRAGLVSLGVSDAVVGVVVWVAAAYFLLGTGLNAASRSRPERLVMTPLCAVLCVLTTVVALG